MAKTRQTKTKSKKATSGRKTKSKAKAAPSHLRYEVKLTILLAATLFIGLALFSDATSFVGAFLRDLLTGLLSYYAFVFPIAFFACIFAAINPNMAMYRKRVYAATAFLSLAMIMAMGLIMLEYNPSDIFSAGGIAHAYSTGQLLLSLGVIGQFLFTVVYSAIGYWGSIVVIITALMLFGIFAFNITPTIIGKKIGQSAVVTNQKIGGAIKSGVEQLRQTDSNSALNDDKKNIIDLLETADFSENLVADDSAEQDLIDNFDSKAHAAKRTEVVDDEGNSDYGSITIVDYEERRKPFEPVKERVAVEKTPKPERKASASATRQTAASKATMSASTGGDGTTAIKDLKAIKKENAVITHEEVDAVETTISHQVEKSYDDYRIPRTTLLNFGSHDRSAKDNKAILDKAKLLEQTLADFKIDARVVQVSKGPMITRFEIQPSPGVKVSKIVNLTDDIALNLAATSVRIVAPIPGKAAIGIEVPNKDTSIVTLRDVIETDSYSAAVSPIRFALGKGISGQPIVADLSKMPHLLIAGATGSGKSVCVNTIITSILFNAKPDEVKFLMIDPKVVELNVYNGIPHLILPVVTDPKKASIALNWAVQEMTERYNQFAENSVRDINSFNKKAVGESELRVMPRIVVIIDELADLMMVAPNQVEDAICRLAQMARAAGIHLIVATQRPSVDVITGVIKANIPSRIAFAVSSQVDSRTIIDMAGAEKLLGKGDMLYYPVGRAKPLRVQGSFISEEEVESVVAYVKSEVDGELHYDEVSLDDVALNMTTSDQDDVDELLTEAIEFVIRSEKASTSLLQRQFRIGYNRAARMIDEIEARGVIGPSRGSKPREVLVTWQEYEMADQ